MKLFLLLFLNLCFTVIVSSQITITSNDIIKAGDSLFLAIDTIPNNTVISPGGTGNQTWDFSNLEEHGVDSIYLLHADVTPYFSVFPTSNVAAFVLSGSLYVYLTRDETGLFQNGMVGDLTENGELDTITNTNPETMVETPLSYNVAYQDTITREMAFGNMKVVQTIYKQDTIDAYGDITVPSGTYNSLRKYTHSSQIDSIFSYIGGNWVFIQENISEKDKFEWWTNDPLAKFFVCSFEYDLTGDTVVGKVEHLKEVKFSGVNKITSQNYLIYPNPGNGIFTIKNNLNLISSAELFDYTGKLIKSYYPKSAVFSINISDKSEGIYLLRVNSAEKSKTFKIILTH